MHNCGVPFFLADLRIYQLVISKVGADVEMIDMSSPSPFEQSGALQTIWCVVL
jgi:hypothetical protein